MSPKTSLFGQWSAGVMIWSSVCHPWWCRGSKLYHRVPSRALPICLFRHFCRRMFHLATKHIECQCSAKKLTGNTAIIENADMDQSRLKFETVNKLIHILMMAIPVNSLLLHCISYPVWSAIATAAELYVGSVGGLCFIEHIHFLSGASDLGVTVDSASDNRTTNTNPHPNPTLSLLVRQPISPIAH